jgi:hypothetical protein
VAGCLPGSSRLKRPPSRPEAIEGRLARQAVDKVSGSTWPTCWSGRTTTMQPALRQCLAGEDVLAALQVGTEDLLVVAQAEAPDTAGRSRRAWRRSPARGSLLEHRAGVDHRVDVFARRGVARSGDAGSCSSQSHSRRGAAGRPVHRQPARTGTGESARRPRCNAPTAWAWRRPGARPARSESACRCRSPGQGLVHGAPVSAPARTGWSARR